MTITLYSDISDARCCLYDASAATALSCR